MNFKTKLAVLAIGAAMGSMAFNASACSTVIVGKDASATGNILVGHNEDNGGRILTAQHWVPAATHKAGEMIKFEEAAASIPQVEKTFGFFWSQTFDPTGASFSDGFVNENGVTIVTNACTGIYKDDIMPTKDGGIGYGIRRLMAERATSARHAVDIAIELLGKYGYFSEGRTYTIADPNEAWQLAIHQGNTWVARRVQDNEVVYIPNNFMMDKVDLNDKETWRIEPKQVERAVKDGRHDAKNPIFNWRKVVAQESVRHERWNANRNVLAWKFLTGVEYNDPEKFPYSAVIDRKLGVKDAMALLRLHEDYIGQDQELYHSKSEGICRTTSRLQPDGRSDAHRSLEDARPSVSVRLRAALSARRSRQGHRLHGSGHGHEGTLRRHSRHVRLPCRLHAAQRLQRLQQRHRLPARRRTRQAHAAHPG